VIYFFLGLCRGSIWASTEAASERTSLVDNLLGVASPTPARCLIFGDVIGDGGRLLGGFAIVISSYGMRIAHTTKSQCSRIKKMIVHSSLFNLFDTCSYMPTMVI